LPPNHQIENCTTAPRFTKLIIRIFHSSYYYFRGLKVFTPRAYFHHPAPKFMARTKLTASHSQGIRKLWSVEKPLLNQIAHNKGFKRTPFKGGAPSGTPSGLLHIMHTVELKKPAVGHVRAYRKKYEHTNSWTGHARAKRLKIPKVRRTLGVRTTRSGRNY